MLLKIVKTVVSLAVVVFFAILIVVAMDLYRPLKIAGEKAIFEVERGTGAGAVARALRARGLIRTRLLFLANYRLFFYPQKIKAGEYALIPPLREKDVLDMLVKGKVMFHSVTIPEGLTGQEVMPLVAPLLADGVAGFEAAFRDTRPVSGLDDKAKDLEGYLFPETYSFPRGIASSEVVKTMVDEFEKVFGGGWRSRAGELRITVRQVVILASLVEKETSVPEEKRLVSAVFHNRLRLGMKLDCDPTIIYALKLKAGYLGRLTKRDLALDSPYNTYLYPGLPPGPICNPGQESLEAALFPAPTNYLYFVSKNDGSHYFSRTFAEHQAAVRRYQKPQ
jgi:UPF0755 protein